MSDDNEPSSPTCSLSQAPSNYAFAHALSQDEIVALLNRVRDDIAAGELPQAESRIRESLPLVEGELRAALVAMLAAPPLDVERIDSLRLAVART